MRETITFIVIQLLVLSSTLIVAGKPYLADYRPQIISEKPGVQDALQLLLYVVVITMILLVLKFLGLLRLRFLIDASVFVAAYFYAAILTDKAVPSILFAVLVIIFRQTKSLLLFNATSSIAIIACSLLFGLFIPPDIVLLILAGMSVYDVIGVLYTQHIKYIWIDDAMGNGRDGSRAITATAQKHRMIAQKKTQQSAKTKNGTAVQELVPSWRNTLALIFPEGTSSVAVVGSGDFAMPALLTASVTLAGGLFAGLICLVMSSAGFLGLHIFSENTSEARKTGIPGIPLLALSCIIGVMLSRLIGILPPG